MYGAAGKLPPEPNNVQTTILYIAIAMDLWDFFRGKNDA
jgi:hypothetical protein